jgi:hypothetical protein
MNETCAFVTTVVFMYWMKNHFVPRKESGNVLDCAAENGIIQLSSRRHNMLFSAPNPAFLQAIDILAVSRENLDTHSNPCRKITRLQFGRLFTAAWNQAGTVRNGSAGFSA